MLQLVLSMVIWFSLSTYATVCRVVQALAPSPPIAEIKHQSSVLREIEFTHPRAPQTRFRIVVDPPKKGYSNARVELVPDHPGQPVQVMAGLTGLGKDADGTFHVGWVIAVDQETILKECQKIKERFPNLSKYQALFALNLSSDREVLMQAQTITMELERFVRSRRQPSAANEPLNFLFTPRGEMLSPRERADYLRKLPFKERYEVLMKLPRPERDAFLRACTPAERDAYVTEAARRQAQLFGILGSKSPPMEITDAEFDAYFNEQKKMKPLPGLSFAAVEYLARSVPLGGKLKFEIANKETLAALKSDKEWKDSLLGRYAAKVGLELDHLEKRGEFTDVVLVKKHEPPLFFKWEPEKVPAKPN